MWWLRSTDPSHAPCESARKALEQIISDQRKEIASLHDRLIGMHTVGLDEHRRAQQERSNLHALEFERAKKQAATGKPAAEDGRESLDLRSVLVHDSDESFAVEQFAPARRVPDPESVADE
jgi:hypothetical protein